MAIGQETEGRGIGGFMQRSQKQWEQQRMLDAQEEMRRQREMQAEETKKRESDGGGQEKKKDSGPASRSGTNTPSSSIASIGSNALTLPAAGVGGSTGVTFGSTHAALMNELTSRGVKPEVAAGAVGSMMGESGRHLNPSLYGYDVNGPSGGLAQWHDKDGQPGGRFTALLNFAGVSKDQAVQNGKLTIPVETQAKFLGHELDTSHNRVLKELQGASTVKDGNRIWTVDFEVPANKEAQAAKRASNGEAFWNYWQRNGDQLAGTTPGSRNRDAGNARSPVQFAANTTTMNDASPARAPQPDAGATPTTPGGATTPVATSSTTTPATTGVTPNPGADAPLPPRRPDDIGSGAPLPPRRPDDLGQTAQPAAPATQQAQQDDGVSGFFKDISSIFGDGKDKYGREWDALYGFEKPPGDIAAASQRSNDAAKASDAPSMLDRSSAATATSADSSKSIFSDMPDIGAAFTPALNFFSSLFG